MAKEWIDIADTAIKIGLGSAITGFFTYIGMKVSHSNSQKKFMIEHKTKVIEKIADDLDVYFATWSSLISIISGMTKNMAHDKENVKFTSDQMTIIHERDEELVKAWPKRQSSTSRLRLLKADAASEKLEECTNFETKLRNMMFFDKEYPNYNQMQKYIEDASKVKKEFQSELANFYEKLID